MSDRELMKKAAKAAGIDYSVSDTGCLMIAPHMNPLAKSVWNPLEDDGDALRLVVKLGMGILVCTNSKRAGANVDDLDYLIELFGGDPYAATRRAIVRAAAALAED